MPTTINASNTSGGAVVTGDGSGVLELQSGGVTALTANGANVTVAGTLTATGGVSGGLVSPATVAGNSTAGAEIRLPEDTDNGSNYVALKAANALAANLTLTLPAADGTNGQVLQTNGSGVLAFASLPPSGTLEAIATGSLSNGSTVVINTDGTVSAVFGFSNFVFESAETNDISAVYDSVNQKVVIAYRDTGNSNFGTAVVGTVSGTSISFGTPVVWQSLNVGNVKAVYDTNAQKVVIAYKDAGNSNFGTVAVPSDAGYIPNLTSENFIGISSAAYTNGQTATIQIIGAVDDAQSSLTPGQSYFVLLDGTLNLTAGTPSVFAGTAVAANKIIVKG